MYQCDLKIPGKEVLVVTLVAAKLGNKRFKLELAIKLLRTKE